MTNIIAAVGKLRNSIEVSSVLDSISPIRIVDDPPSRQYIGSPLRGIDLLLENDRVVSVQLYTQKTRSFSPCSDELPFGLQKSMNQVDVHKLLGMPVESSNISSKYALTDLGVKLVVTYDGAKNIRLLNIDALD